VSRIEFTATIAQLQRIIGVRDTIHTCARTQPGTDRRDASWRPLSATPKLVEQKP
jgi:hypothetical protein